MNQHQYNKKVAEIIKALRELRQIKQVKIAEELCLSQSVYSRIERGEISISLGQLHIICRTFNISLFQFISLTESVVSVVTPPPISLLLQNAVFSENDFTVCHSKP